MVHPNLKTFFRGRPDGLGNRLEEIIWLSAFQAREPNSHFIYLWNLSPRLDRNYLPRFRSPIKVLPSLIPLPRSSISDLCFDHPTSTELKQAAAHIALDRQSAPHDLVIHLRASDRIDSGNSHPHFMDPPTHVEILDRAAEYASQGWKTICIVGDDQHVASSFCQHLRSRGARVSVNDSRDVWGDLSILLAANDVIMASKFSSFALIGSLLGSRRVHVPRESRRSDIQRFGLEPIAIF